LDQSESSIAQSCVIKRYKGVIQFSAVVSLSEKDGDSLMICFPLLKKVTLIICLHLMHAAFFIMNKARYRNIFYYNKKDVRSKRKKAFLKVKIIVPLRCS